MKGIIVDEDGLDVMYWRKLNSSQKHRSSFKKQSKEEQGSEERFVNRIQDLPLLRGESFSSDQEAGISGGPIPNPPSLQLPINPPPPPKPLETVTFADILARKSDSPPKIGASGVSLKPPTPVNVGASCSNGQVKINNSNQSMVWNNVDRGSFKVDDDLMEALFGYVATNRKTPSPLNAGNLSPPQSGQIFILEKRKSQNIAIILKSLPVSSNEILHALTLGRRFTLEALEKLIQISPTEEEKSEILNFAGDQTKLAAAEYFLFHILKAIPSAFTQFNAMLLKLNCEAEILNLKESIDTVDEGCKELQTRGLFTKILETVLKAGNRMNAGTCGGNAQAFNLNALKKIADVKSTDGKTTLLHFVVEEVVRSEGRKCVMSQSKSVTPQSPVNIVDSDNPEKEYMMLGLPIIGGLSQEFSNVKKAATIDYKSFSGHCSILRSHVLEIQDIVSRISKGGFKFGTDMLEFLNTAESELSDLRKQQNSVVELAKSTIEYYQGCAFKEKRSNPLHLFVIIRDFLNMIDLVCVEIARNVQKKKIVVAEMGSSTRKTKRFPKLPPGFMPEKSNESDHGSL